MLLSYYKLHAQPFGVTPDPRFLFFSPTHREALASVMHGILSGRGFTALIAEPGMGKTTLLFEILRRLKGTAKTAFLFQTPCGPREFLRALLADLAIEDNGRDFMRMHAKLNGYLLRESQQGGPVVVIIDEAQNLDDRVLEVVRMLSNFEASNKKLMQIVLAGQPQLAERLSSESLTQLRQRISIVARLAPFDAQETRAYIEHRLQLARCSSDKPLFTAHAYGEIAKHSHGIPRNINNLCFNAMSLGCALERRIVDASIVQETIDDLNLTNLIRPPVKADAGKVQETSQRPLSLSESVLCSSAKWRIRAFLDGALLSLMRWPSNRAGESARKRFLPDVLGKISKRRANDTVKGDGKPGAASLKAKREGSVRLKRAQTAAPVEANRQLENATKSAREQNTVPAEFAAHRENR
jgi:type II secretory pathway predicted ATPase ExeA